VSETTTKTLPARDTDPWQRSAVSGNLIPREGVGASHGYGSDCYPYTIIKVSKTGHQIVLRPDNSRVVSGSFICGDAVCEFTSRKVTMKNNTDLVDGDRIATRRNTQHRCGNCGSISPIKVSKCDRTIGCKQADDQAWYPVYKMKGSTGRGVPSVGIGYRRYYQDPHF
jgi:hypothetical protein